MSAAVRLRSKRDPGRIRTEARETAMRPGPGQRTRGGWGCAVFFCRVVPQPGLRPYSAVPETEQMRNGKEPTTMRTGPRYYGKVFQGNFQEIASTTLRTTGP